MRASAAQFKANFSVLAQRADAGEEIIITKRGKPAYQLLPIVTAPQRVPFPNVTALAMQSKPCKESKRGARKAGCVDVGLASFVAAWRAQGDRF
jgi:prevent-host-death family protein